MSLSRSWENLGKYRLRVTRSFERDFLKLDIQLKRRMESSIRNLETNHHLGKSLRGELSGKWSLRIGDYRIVYIIDEHKKTITLYNVKHRKIFISSFLPSPLYPRIEGLDLLFLLVYPNLPLYSRHHIIYESCLMLTLLNL